MTRIVLLLLLSFCWAPTRAVAIDADAPVAVVALQDIPGEDYGEFESEEMGEFARLGTYVLLIVAIGLVAWLLSS